MAAIWEMLSTVYMYSLFFLSIYHLSTHPPATVVSEVSWVICQPRSVSHGVFLPESISRKGQVGPQLTCLLVGAAPMPVTEQNASGAECQEPVCVPVG